MEKEKKQVVFDAEVYKDLQELYPNTTQLSKYINQAVQEFVAKEKLKKLQEVRLEKLSNETGVPKDILQAQLIAKALNDTSEEL